MHSEGCLEIGHCRWRATTFARRWVNNLGWRRKRVFLLQLSCDGGKDNSRAFTRQSQITLGGMRPNLSGKNLMGLLRPKVPSFSFDKISLPVQREFIHPSLFPDKILKIAIWAVKKGHPLKDLVAVVFWQILICGKILAALKTWENTLQLSSFFKQCKGQCCWENSLNLYDLLGGFVEAPGKYLWHFLRVLWIPFKSYISVAPSIYETDITMQCMYTPWKLCQLTLHHTATGISAKAHHQQNFVWFPICESILNETC